MIYAYFNSHGSRALSTRNQVNFRDNHYWYPADPNDSKSANPNDNVNFKVEEDVVVNGHVLIRKDTPAIGSVIHAPKGGYMGKSGKLGIQIQSTQTVDGQLLKLRAARAREGDDKTNSTASLAIISPLFLFRKGGEAKIYEGTRILVYVGEDKRFRMEDGKPIAVTPVPIDPR